MFYAEMDNYAIVEFNDGLQIIASKWLSEDRKFSYWPSFTSIQRYDRAVEKMEYPEDTWSRFPVLRIMATTNSFQKGKSKLKQAETMSDLNTDDIDEIRKRRRENAQKRICSSSDDEGSAPPAKISKLPPFPKQPSLQIQKIGELASTSGVQNNGSIVESQSNGSLDPAYITENSDKPFQNMMLRMLVDLKHKMNSVILSQQEILQKLQSVNTCEPLTENETYETVINDFPLHTEEALQALEEKLKTEAKFKESMIKELSKFGGGDMKTIVRKLLELMLTNPLGDTYSYVGGKKKRVFASLQLCKVIQEVTRKHIKSCTDDDVAVCIKSWLRHTKDRVLREQK
ncbi:uncharacterized protein LOC134543808 [Bacillus rossius redtenbacheri]